MKIRVDWDPSPYDNRYLYAAIDDDTYEGDPSQPIGRGPTEAAAIADLLEQMDIDDTPWATVEPVEAAR